MRRMALVVCTIVWLAMANHTISGQGMISRDQASRVGMVVQWFAQVEGVGPSELINLRLVVDENKSTTFFEVIGGRLREVVSENDISPFGASASQRGLLR